MPRTTQPRLYFLELLGQVKGYDRKVAKAVSIFSDVVWEKVSEGHTVILPPWLGRLVAHGKPTPYHDKKLMKVDWGLTQKQRAIDPKAREEKKVWFHDNLHTDGFFVVTKNTHRSWRRQSMYYKFYPAAPGRKKLSASFAENPEKFIKIIY